MKRNWLKSTKETSSNNSLFNTFPNKTVKEINSPDLPQVSSLQQLWLQYVYMVFIDGLSLLKASLKCLLYAHGCTRAFGQKRDFSTHTHSVTHMKVRRSRHSFAPVSKSNEPSPVVLPDAGERRLTPCRTGQVRWYQMR